MLYTSHQHKHGEQGTCSSEWRDDQHCCQSLRRVGESSMMIKACHAKREAILQPSVMPGSKERQRACSRR